MFSLLLLALSRHVNLKARLPVTNKTFPRKVIQHNFCIENGACVLAKLSDKHLLKQLPSHFLEMSFLKFS